MAQNYIVRGHRNNADGSLNYTKPFYIIVPTLEELNDIKVQENTSYYLLNFTTKEKPNGYSVIRPKLDKKVFYFLELEQHRGAIKLQQPLTSTDVEMLKTRHNALMPKELQTDNALMAYSTGGGVNLIFKIKDAPTATRQFRKVRTILNRIIEDNAFSAQNTDGIYDEGYHFSNRVKILRLPLKDTRNPKYNNRFNGVEFNANAPEIDLNAMVDSIKALTTEEEGISTILDAQIFDIYQKCLSEKLAEAEAKVTEADLEYLEELGYELDGTPNTCIHPDHLDLTPSMTIDNRGRGYCHSGTGHEHERYFSIQELVKAKDGDVRNLSNNTYISDTMSFSSTPVENDTMRIAIRHIERNRVMFIGDTIDLNTKTYNYNNGAWENSNISHILYIAREVMAEVAKKSLYKIHKKFGEAKELKDSNLYKELKKSVSVKVDNTHTTMVKTLIAKVSTNIHLLNKCLYHNLPSEPAWTIPFTNGIYEAKTGNLRPITPADRVLSYVGVRYKKFNDYSEIEELLDEWTGGEGLQLAIGLSRALSRTSSGKMLFLLGEGANGKTTLTTDILTKVLNRQNSLQNRASTLSIKALVDNDTNNFFLQDLASKSVNFSNEIEHYHAELDGLKNKTESADMIQVNVKHKSPFSIRFEATLILSGNSMPVVPVDDFALLRRIQIFEFPMNYALMKTEEEKRAFMKRIRSKEFKEKFFSYLAQIYSRFYRGEISEQSLDFVRARLERHNNLIKALIDDYYEFKDGATAELEPFLALVQDKENKKKRGHHWGLESVIKKLNKLGITVDYIQDPPVMVGVREKRNGGIPTPPKPTKKQEPVKMEKKQKVTKEKGVEMGLMEEFRAEANKESTFTIAPKRVLTEVQKILDTKTLEGREIIALDIETTGLIPSSAEVALIQIKRPNKEIQLLKMGEWTKEEVTKILKHLFAGNAMLGHNLAFDLSFLKHHFGLDVIKDDIYILDTMLLSRIDRSATTITEELQTNPLMSLKADYFKKQNGYSKKFNLKTTAKFYLGIELNKDEQTSDWSGDLTEEQLEYARNDVRHLHALYTEIIKNLKAKDLELIAQLESRATNAIIDANAHTLTIDVQEANKLETKMQKVVDTFVEQYNKQMRTIVKELWETEEDMLTAFRQDKALKAQKPFKAVTLAKMKKDIIALTDKNGLYISKSKAIFKYIMSKYLNTEVTSTDKKGIKALMDKHIIFKTIAEMTTKIKELEDLKRTIYNRTEEGRIISKLNQIGTITGRMSSSAISEGKQKAGINLQQINSDSEFRALFTAPKGKKLILADYSGMELRIVAKIAKEETMLKIFKENGDLHTKTASILFKQDYDEMVEILKDHTHPLYKATKALRSKAKSMNFLITYGGGAKALSDGAGITKEEANELLHSYKTEVYPMLAEYISKQQNKELVTSALGRKMASVDEIDNKQYYALKNDSRMAWKAEKFTKAEDVEMYTMAQYTNPVNFPIQSTGADIVKLALVLLIEQEDYIKDDVHISHIVHDEIILEVAEDKAEKWRNILQKTMETAGNIVMDNKVYMEAEANIGSNWNEAK